MSTAKVGGGRRAVLSLMSLAGMCVLATRNIHSNSLMWTLAGYAETLENNNNKNHQPDRSHLKKKHAPQRDLSEKPTLALKTNSETAAVQQQRERAVGDDVVVQENRRSPLLVVKEDSASDSSRTENAHVVAAMNKQTPPLLPTDFADDNNNNKARFNNTDSNNLMLLTGAARTTRTKTKKASKISTTTTPSGQKDKTSNSGQKDEPSETADNSKLSIRSSSTVVDNRRKPATGKTATAPKLAPRKKKRKKKKKTKKRTGKAVAQKAAAPPPLPFGDSPPGSINNTGIPEAVLRNASLDAAMLLRTGTGTANQISSWNYTYSTVLAPMRLRHSIPNPLNPTNRILPPYFPLPKGMYASAKDYDWTWKLIAKSRRLLVNYVPKVMCTSIRDAMNSIECSNQTIAHRIAQAKRRGNTVNKKREELCAQARFSLRARKAKNYKFTRAIMVRDPFERALSAYHNSATNPFIYLPGCASTSECTFDEWMQIIERNRALAFHNNHTRPQVEIAQLDKIHYHYILRMSSAVDQEFFWHDLLGVKPLHANVRHNTTTLTSSKKTRIPAPPKEFTPEILKRIATIYADDLVLWEQVLQHGTPRQPGEYTVYDYYKQQQQQQMTTAKS